MSEQKGIRTNRIKLNKEKKARKIKINFNNFSKFI